MTPETKKKAVEKLSTVKVKVGYPDKWKDYSSVAITRDGYFADVLAVERFQVADDRAKIGKPVNRDLWGMTPPTSNAYYNPLLNEIVFPAGILQPPAFSVDVTDAVNYGAIGVVIGHEISHGFDDQGAQFDAQGRLQNWWSPEDLKQFQAKTACVAKRSWGREDRVPRLSEVVAGQASRADDRWLHSRAAVLHRVGTVPRRRDSSRDAEEDGAGRSPPGGEVPCARASLELSTVRGDVRLQGWVGDGAA
jgi:hypothetical protein